MNDFTFNATCSTINNGHNWSICHSPLQNREALLHRRHLSRIPWTSQEETNRKVRWQHLKWVNSRIYCQTAIINNLLGIKRILLPPTKAGSRQGQSRGGWGRSGPNASAHKNVYDGLCSAAATTLITHLMFYDTFHVGHVGAGLRHRHRHLPLRRQKGGPTWSMSRWKVCHIKRP